MCHKQQPLSINPTGVWKLVAGKTTTHLPEQCIFFNTPMIYHNLMERPRVVPHVLDFGSMYEDVLEYFTERMLGVNDFIPFEKRGLLNKLFDSSGYVRHLDMRGKHGFVPDMYPI